MGTRGRPKISEFVEHCISYKVMQWAKHYNFFSDMIDHRQPKNTLPLTKTHHSCRRHFMNPQNGYVPPDRSRSGYRAPRRQAEVSVARYTVLFWGVF